MKQVMAPHPALMICEDCELWRRGEPEVCAIKPGKLYEYLMAPGREELRRKHQFDLPNIARLRLQNLSAGKGVLRRQVVQSTGAARTSVFRQ